MPLHTRKSGITVGLFSNTIWFHHSPTHLKILEKFSIQYLYFLSTGRFAVLVAKQKTRYATQKL